MSLESKQNPPHSWGGGIKTYGYNYGYKALNEKDHEALFSISPELAFHFEQCVGLTSFLEGDHKGTRYRYVFDPKGAISEDEFKHSVDFIDKYFAEICNKIWWQNNWNNILKNLSEYPSPYIFEDEPQLLTTDVYAYPDAPCITLIYETVVLDVNRTYGLTSCGKLVLFSHGSHLKTAPYTKANYDYLQDTVREMEVLHGEMTAHDNVVGLSDHTPFIPKSKKEFEEQYPHGNVAVVVIGMDFYSTNTIVSVKARRYYDSDGKEVDGRCVLAKEGIEYGALFEQCFEARAEYRKLRKQYMQKQGELEKRIVACRA